MYGENETFLSGLTQLEVGYVLALRPSHSWWHALRAIGTIGSVQEVAQAAEWHGPENAGDWQQVTRQFRDGDTEMWWALEGKCSAYGPDKSVRLVIATTDPATLPELTTWYLITNVPAPGSARDTSENLLEAAALSEVVRLYGLRMWVEQSYKQVKQALGWADYQIRQDEAMRRHWQLVCCAFSFCWWAHAHDPMCAHLLTLARTGQPAEVHLHVASTQTTEVGGENGEA